MTIQRTTLAAETDDLALLKEEARRRGVSLAQVLRELVAREAATIRRGRRPSFGFVTSGGTSAAEQSWRDEDAPVSRPFRT
jgi:hypothetical protein